MFQGAMFRGPIPPLSSVMGDQSGAFVFFGRPPLRSRAALFQMARTTFRGKPKWSMATFSSSSRPTLLRSALNSSRFSVISASTARS